MTYISICSSHKAFVWHQKTLNIAQKLIIYFKMLFGVYFLVVLQPDEQTRWLWTVVDELHSKDFMFQKKKTNQIKSVRFWNDMKVGK